MRNNANLKVLLSCEIMQKAFFHCFAAFVCLIFASQGYANGKCGSNMGYDGACVKGDPNYGLIDVSSSSLNKANPGCEQLKVTITNNTNYSFSLTNSTGLGDLPSSLSSIEPGVNEYTVTGAYSTDSKRDEIDKTLEYTAKISGQTVGSTFTLHLLKDSCNISTTECQHSDSECYCRSQASSHDCLWNAQCEYCTYTKCTGGWDPSTWHCTTTSQVCKSDYSDAPYCGDKVPDEMTDDSTVTVTSSNNSIYIDPAVHNDPPVFNCTKAAVCSASSTDSVPGTMSFTINPAVIEHLTITFFSSTFPSTVNTQSPLAKTILNALYDNLNAALLGQLGTYYSVQPVKIEDTETDKDKAITFSTLCNSAECLQASS